MARRLRLTQQGWGRRRGECIWSLYGKRRCGFCGGCRDRCDIPRATTVTIAWCAAVMSCRLFAAHRCEPMLEWRPSYLFGRPLDNSPSLRPVTLDLIRQRAGSRTKAVFHVLEHSSQAYPSGRGHQLCSVDKASHRGDEDMSVEIHVIDRLSPPAVKSVCQPGRCLSSADQARS